MNHNYEIKSIKIHLSRYYEITSQHYEILTHNYETKSTLWHTTVGHSETTDIKTEKYEIIRENSNDIRSQVSVNVVLIMAKF